MGYAKVTNKKAKKVIESSELDNHYTGIVWTMISFATVVEKVLYRLDQEVRNTGIAEAEGPRQLMLHYYDVFKDLVLEAGWRAHKTKHKDAIREAYDEVVCDMMYRMEKDCNKRIDSFVNAMLRSVKKTHGDNPMCACLLGCLCNLCRVMSEYFEVNIDKMGYGARFPDDIPRGMDVMVIFLQKTDQVYAAIMQGRPQPEPAKATKTLTEQFNKLIDLATSGKKISDAVVWATKNYINNM